MKIDGRAVAFEIYDDLKGRVGELTKNGVIPHMSVILATDDPAITSYVNQKKKWSEYIGAKITIYSYPKTVSKNTLSEKVKELNEDTTVHAIVVQQPLPEHINADHLTHLVSPQKDIDGFQEHSQFDVPVSLAVMKILEEIHKNIKVSNDTLSWLRSKSVVVLGKGPTAGRPIIDYLRKREIALTVIDSKTDNPNEIIKNADILITAAGKPSIIKADTLKKGVILIGVGLSMKEGKLKGDFDEEEIEHIASFYTPSPGGVGPINVAYLLSNLVQSAEN